MKDKNSQGSNSKGGSKKPAVAKPDVKTRVMVEENSKGDDFLKAHLKPDIVLEPELANKLKDYGFKNPGEATMGDLIRAMGEVNGTKPEDLMILRSDQPGYYEEFGQYVIAGDMHEEGTVCWCGLPHALTDAGTLCSFRMDLDILEKQFGVELVPVRCDYCLNKSLLDLRFEQDKLYKMAQEEANLYEECGFAIICKDGQFHVPCQCFWIGTTKEEIFSPIIFNAYGATPAHHQSVGITIDVGSLTINTVVRYVKDHNYDMKHRYNQEVEAYTEFMPSFNPEGDPYDEPDWPGDWDGPDGY